MAETFNFDTLRGSGTPLLAKMVLNRLDNF